MKGSICSIFDTVHELHTCTHMYTHAFLTSMKELSVLSVGLCVIRNRMFLWHSSTGAGRFMVASGISDLFERAAHGYS